MNNDDKQEIVGRRLGPEYNKAEVNALGYEVNKIPSEKGKTDFSIDF